MMPKNGATVGGGGACDVKSKGVQTMEEQTLHKGNAETLVKVNFIIDLLIKKAIENEGADYDPTNLEGSLEYMGLTILSETGYGDPFDPDANTAHEVAEGARSCDWLDYRGVVKDCRGVGIYTFEQFYELVEVALFLLGVYDL